MEMHQVRYFLAAAAAKNFTKAAAACGVSPPSLLRGVGLLEHEFGGALFTRTRGNIQLTELGRIAHPHLQQIANEADEAKRRVKLRMSVERTALKLGIMCTIAPCHFVDLLGAFRKRHPQIMLEIIDRTANELQSALLAGELELAIYGRPEEFSIDTFHVMPLFKERMVIAVAEDHPLSQDKPIKLTELDGEPYLERSNCEFARMGEAVFLNKGVSGPTVYSSERDDWVLAMVATGLGYSFLPESTARFSGVRIRPLIEPEFWRQINLISVRGRPHSAAVGAFVREVMRTKWMGDTAISKLDVMGAKSRR